MIDEELLQVTLYVRRRNTALIQLKKEPMQAVCTSWGGGNRSGNANIRAISMWRSTTHVLSVVYALFQLSPYRHFSTSGRLSHNTNLIRKNVKRVWTKILKMNYFLVLWKAQQCYTKVPWSVNSPFSILCLFSIHKILLFYVFFPTALVWQSLIACLGWGAWNSWKLTISLWWRSETWNSIHEINGLVALWNFILVKFLSSSPTYSLHLELNLEGNWSPDIMSRLWL